MGKKKIITIVCIIIIILAIGVYFAVDYFLDKDLEKQEQELQETIDE